MTFLEIDPGRCVKLEEIAAIEDVDPGSHYSSAVVRTRVTLCCGTSFGSHKSYSELRDALIRAVEK